MLNEYFKGLIIIQCFRLCGTQITINFSKFKLTNNQFLHFVDWDKKQIIIYVIMKLLTQLNVSKNYTLLKFSLMKTFQLLTNYVFACKFETKCSVCNCNKYSSLNKCLVNL